LSSSIEWDGFEVTVFVMSLAGDKEGTVNGRIVDLRPHTTGKALETCHKSFTARDGLCRRLCIEEDAQ
jgi:hypothetical protein